VDYKMEGNVEAYVSKKEANSEVYFERIMLKLL
jgi:hypothetical protein